MVEQSTEVESGIKLMVSVIPVKCNIWKVIYDTVNQNQIHNQFEQLVSYTDKLRFDRVDRIF